ncbi:MULTISPECIES: PP2C family protein-serine/threonine phosphatase [Kitasatospora]|uniref:PPM-type phosphatase domain-containing protein n=1 Tax=Kitasatospora arboriphila TaxID=258052 RepID=A0ABN1U8K1_9ACTN
MDAPAVDYGAAFRATPSPMLVLTPGLVMADANEAYLRVSGRNRAELVGRLLFDVFPGDPAHGETTGAVPLRASLQRVITTRQSDSMPLQKYGVDHTDRPGVFEERYWSTLNTPVLGADGEVVAIVHRVEEVTALVRSILDGRGPADGTVLTGLTREAHMAADLLARAQELADLNEELRQAHAREREVALSLQRSLLPAVPPAHRSFAAVRYQPATRTLNVCGDWYDLVDLDRSLLGVAVGDVVGHGLEAAGIMGRLHSALNAALRATRQPAQALKTLARYAVTVEGALSTTAVQTVVDRSTRTVRYSSAGHPPPVLVHADGSVQVLDGATDPPLGAWENEIPRSEAAAGYRPGATLVLYTDGLIERRGEDIDVGLERLTASAARHRGLGPEALADAVLADLGADDGQGTDDIALVAVRL